jgi:hypothetical protein
MWPQVGKGLVSLSAIHYRKMYLSARAAMDRSGAANDEILFGGLAPRAFLPKVGVRATQPLRFLRDFFCLDDKLKPLRGRAAKARSCTGKYKRINATGFAYHPYTVPAGPFIKPTSPDDAPIAYMKRIYRVLDRAAKYKRLSRKRMPLWDAEFAYQSNPPDINQTSIGKIPGFLNTAEYLSYKDPRIKTYAQFQLIDDAADLSQPVGSKDRYGGFQSGLKFESGERKPGVYAAYRMPLMVFKTASPNVVKVWGDVRAKIPGTQSVEIQTVGGGSKTVASVTTNPLGYFNATIKLKGAARKSFRAQANGISSRTAKPGKAVRASSK